jgi:hypothetical protein
MAEMVVVSRDVEPFVRTILEQFGGALDMPFDAPPERQSIVLFAEVRDLDHPFVPLKLSSEDGMRIDLQLPRHQVLAIGSGTPADLKRFGFAEMTK